MIFLSAGFLVGVALLVLGIVVRSWEGVGVGGGMAVVWGAWLWLRYLRHYWESR